MLSRRDKLLIHPWQQRQFENHRRKVQSALPAIDNKPPANRNHVSTKLKKQQKENERCATIEKHNLILLQKLNYVMKTNRVDNYWSIPQPNFLNRVSIYPDYFKRDDLSIIETELEEDWNIQEKPTRKSKCLACTPVNVAEQNVPEERIPWEPEKKSISRIRSKSVPIFKPRLEKITEKLDGTKQINLADKPKRSKSCKINETRIKGKILSEIPQSLTLSRGSLTLVVNFPSDSVISLKDGLEQKTLVKGFCQCKNAPRIRVN